MTVSMAPRITRQDEGSPEYDGYFCIKTKPHICSCCPDPWLFVHFSDKIVVWEENDDPLILHVAHQFQQLGIDPRIVEYKPVYGKAVTWDDIPARGTVG